MKFFIGLTTLLFASGVFANPYNSKSEGQGLRSLPPTYVHAAAEVTITRSTIVKKGDSYEPVSENICTKPISFDVYDMRQQSGTEWATQWIECETTVKGKVTKVGAYFMAVVSKDGKSDILSLHSGFTQITDNTSRQFNSIVRTREPNTKSLIVVLGPQHESDCSNNVCKPVENEEILTAQIEYLGQQ